MVEGEAPEAGAGESEELPAGGEAGGEREGMGGGKEPAGGEEVSRKARGRSELARRVLRRVAPVAAGFAARRGTRTQLRAR